MDADQPTSWQPDARLLEGKVALVVGGALGIGKATSELLAASGATVVVADKDDESAQALAGQLGDAKTALAIETDVRSESSCLSMVESVVEQLGRIDILANVTGGMGRHAEYGPLVDWSTESWDAIVQLNLRYVFWTCRSALPVMASGGGGAIVNVTSIAGSFGTPDQAAYGAAKAGLINLTKSLAAECGKDRIRVNAVSPGVTLSPATRDAVKGRARENLVGITPLRRIGHVDDIARAVVFLASPMADFITGQMLPVDGGVSINWPYPPLS